MAELDIKKLPSNKKKPVKVKPLRTPRALEQELDNFIKFMVKTSTKRFETKVLQAMNKSTIDKFQDSEDIVIIVKNEVEIFHDSYDNFEKGIPSSYIRETKIPCMIKDLKNHDLIKRIEFLDAQEGNFARIFNKLVKDFKKSINQQFSEKRIQSYIKKLYGRTDKMNDKAFYHAIQSKVGVDAKSIIGTDGLNSFVNAKSLETIGQVVKLKNEIIENLSQNTLRLMSAGKNLETLYEEVTNTKQKNLNKSELVSRNELKAFNTQLNNKRASNLGIQKAVWNTVGDERSRPCHVKRDGLEFDIEKGLYHSCDGEWLKPGEEINCRCFATYVVEFD